MTTEFLHPTCGRHQFATLPGDDRYLQGAKIAFDDLAFVPIAEVYDVGVFKASTATSTASPRCCGTPTSGPSIPC
jgi:hypothetical protein